MNYAKVKDDLIIVYPYSFNNLVEENPNTIFPNEYLADLYRETDSAKDGSSIVEIVLLPEPSVNDRINIAKLNSAPTFVNGNWCLDWTIRLKTDTELQEETFQEEMKIRLKRNEMLSTTDWSQLADATEDTKQFFVSFRQALRDIPQQEGFPWNVVWPRLRP